MSSAFLQRTKPRSDDDVDDILFRFDSNPNSPKKGGFRSDLIKNLNRHRRKASTMNSALPTAILCKLNANAAAAGHGKHAPGYRFASSSSPVSPNLKQNDRLGALPSVYVITAIWDPRVHQFEVLNTETPRGLSILLTG